MSQHSSDLRVRRTQKLLQEAVLALIEERGFDALTVGEIANRAMVSRTAFYRFYQDKYDLVEQIFKEAILTVVSDIEPLRREVLSDLGPQQYRMEPWMRLFEQALQSETVPEPCIQLFEHLAEHERFYRVLLGEKGSSYLRNKICMYLAEMIGKRIQILPLNGSRMSAHHVIADGFVPAMLAGLLVNAMIWWLEHERPYPPRQAATYCFRLVFSTIKEVMTWQ
jgi:AcrR family transcriptional regulator